MSEKNKSKSVYPNRKAVCIPATCEIQAKQDYIVMVVPIGAGTIGIRFISPEHLLTTFGELLQAAEKVWPNNEWVKEYKREEN